VLVGADDASCVCYGGGEVPVGVMTRVRLGWFWGGGRGSLREVGLVGWWVTRGLDGVDMNEYVVSRLHAETTLW
jgi:hypothetical protein